MLRKRRFPFLANLLLILFAVACNAIASTATPAPVETMEDPSPTVAITQVPSPTPSPSVAATATPSPTASPTATPTTPAAPPSQTTVSIGEAQFQAEVADTPQERSQGLSGRPSLAPGTGVLFVFDQPGIYAFWMYEMQFPLDFIWISEDCTVIDLTYDVPPPQPGQSSGDLPRYQPDEPVRYVLEVNAGEIASAGINIGDAVSFEEALGGSSSC